MSEIQLVVNGETPGEGRFTVDKFMAVIRRLMDPGGNHEYIIYHDTGLLGTIDVAEIVLDS